MPTFADLSLAVECAGDGLGRQVVTPDFDTENR